MVTVGVKGLMSMGRLYLLTLKTAYSVRASPPSNRISPLTNPWNVQLSYVCATRAYMSLTQGTPNGLTRGASSTVQPRRRAVSSNWRTESSVTFVFTTKSIGWSLSWHISPSNSQLCSVLLYICLVLPQHTSLTETKENIICLQVAYMAETIIYRVAQKSKPQSFVHIFAKYWRIFKIFSCVKSICIWWRFEQEIGD